MRKRLKKIFSIITIVMLITVSVCPVFAKEEDIADVNVSSDGKCQAETCEEIVSESLVMEASTNGATSISTNGEKFIKEHEGLVLSAYNDGYGTLTIGWGHTANVTGSMTITEAQAQAYFDEDVAKKKKLVIDFATANNIAFTQQQFDALVCMVFNLGTNPLADPTCRLVKAIKKYQNGTSVNIPTNEVWECFATWHHVGKIDSKGLYNRRMDEARLFALGDYTRSTNWKTPSWLKDGAAGQEVPDGWIPEEYSAGVETCTCSEAYAGTYTVTTNSAPLSIRSGHGSSFSSLGTIPKGATVTVTKASGTSASDWAHVEYNGISGYASMEYLTKQEPGVRGTEMTTGGNQVIPDGNYIIVAAAAGDENCRYYLDIDGADVPAVSGTNVHLWSGAQSAISACDCWHLSYSDGFYTITQIGTSISLDVTDGDTLRGKNIQVCEANGSSAQKWAISWNGRNGYTIQAKCSGYCLDVQDIKFEAGTNINQWENNGSDGQAWSFIPVKANVGEDFWALILNTSSWKPIAEAADGNVELASEGGDNYERELWHFVRLSDGTYNIYSAYSGNCLHVVAGADANGANIICYPWRNESYEPQKWSIITKGDNQYFFMPTAISSTRVLDVKDGLSADGTNLQLCDLWCGSPQVFSLYVLGSGDQADYSISAEATELDPGASTTVTVKGTGYINSYKLHIIAPDGKETVLDNKGKQTFQFTAEEAGTYTLYAEVASPVSSSTGSATDRSIQIKVKGSEVEPVAGAKITLASATASAGEEIAIPVALTESPGVVSVEFSVQYDASVLEWTGVLEGEYGGNFDGETGSMITWYAADPRVNETKDGVLATLVFRVKDDAPEGQTEVSITYEVDSVYNADEANVALAVTPGVITVSSYIPGDINGDGKVNNKDVTRLMRYIKYKDVEVVEAALDVNGDGKTNNKDVTRLMRYVKYKDVEIH